MRKTAPHVISADASHLPGIAQSLQRAFHDDPLLLWSMDRARRRPAAATRTFRTWAGALLPQAHTWTTADTAGAAVWALPGQERLSLRTELAMALAGLPATRRPLRTARGLRSIEAAHAREPHLYLALLGVDPAQQGRGLGGALLAPGLARCDEERWPAYLETAKERNVSFYGRLGFAVLRTLQMPGGPPVWLMWREPR